MVKKNITPGAEISIVLANSTIPMVGECFSPGNGDFMWPTCSCGYKLSIKDLYGSNIKCGNIYCTERLNRMRNYLSKLGNIVDIDWNQFLVLVLDERGLRGINDTRCALCRLGYLGNGAVHVWKKEDVLAEK